jgi:hypothetical protein
MAAGNYKLKVIFQDSCYISVFRPSLRAQAFFAGRGIYGLIRFCEGFFLAFDKFSKLQSYIRHL